MTTALAWRRDDAIVFAGGSLLTLLVSWLAVRGSGTLTFAMLLAGALFLATILCFVVWPHVGVALTIPLFAVLPTVKTLWLPQAGPIKDVVTIAATIAAAFVAVRMRHQGIDWIDRPLVLLTGLFLGLYAINLGGGFAPGAYDAGWFHGIRLVAEPLLLLFVGLAIGGERTLRWGIRSLVLTGCGVAAYGVAQQWIGQWDLVGMGYAFEGEVRTINGRLRSFGTLDEPFAYGAFLLLPFAAVLLWLKRGLLVGAAGLVLAAGIVVSLVRSAIIIAVLVLAVALARKTNFTVAAFLVVGAMAAAIAFLVSSSGGTRTETVQAGPSLYLTINGRTEAWSTALGDASTWPVGRGVGEVGAAADRARFTLTRESAVPNTQATAVDSAYFATIADVGIIGLALRIGILSVLVAAAARAARAGSSSGWLASAFLTIMLIDGVTRDSFTGFPTAFLGLLLVGVCLRTAGEELRRRAATPATQ